MQILPQPQNYCKGEHMNSFFEYLFNFPYCNQRSSGTKDESVKTQEKKFGMRQKVNTEKINKFKLQTNRIYLYTHSKHVSLLRNQSGVRSRIRPEAKLHYHEN